MPDTLKPVGKITPIETSAPTVKPVGRIQVVSEEPVTREGFDPLALSAEDQKMKAVGEIIDELDFAGGYNKDEKDYLIALAKNPNVNYSTWNDAKLTLGGEHPKQEGQQTYYFGDNGLPVPLAQSERAPKGKQIESVWGSQASAEDDTILTTIGKNLANTLPNFIQSVGDLIHLPYGIIEGKEADWYKDLKNETESHKAVTSTASNKPFLQTENIENFEDLAKSENWNFTPDNVAGQVSQLASTVLQFVGGAAAAKGIGLGAKAIAATEEAALAGTEVGIGTKVLSKLPYLASSYTNNLATSLEASDAAGIDGREKYAIASLVTLPVSAVETMMGLTGKIASNPELKAERDKLVKSLIKGWKEEGGEMTKESLKELYENTIVSSSAVLGNMAKSTAANMAGEASEEVLQNVLQKSSEAIYDQLYAQDKEIGKGKYGTDITSPQAFAEYINDAVAGALGGGIGGAGIDRFKREKAELQSANAYEYIKQGPEAVQALKASISRAADNGNITPEEQKRAIFKIDTYQKYYDQTKDLNLGDEANRRISDLTWSNENLKVQQQALMDNPESKIKGTIPHRRLLDTEAILEANSKEMSEIMTPKISEQQTAVALKVQEENAKKKTTVHKAEALVNEAIPFKEQVKAAQTGKDLDALLKEADSKGITTPELIDEISKRREQIKPLAPVVTEKVVAPEHKAFHAKIEKVISADKDFNNLMDVRNSMKADIIKEHLEEEGANELKGGVIKLGEYANQVVNGKHLPLYYAVNFGGKEVKFASNEYTKFIKEKNLVDRPVIIQLVKPEDSDLSQLVEDDIIEPHDVVERTDAEGNKSKYFVFHGDANKTRHPYILVARSVTKSGKAGIKIANMAISDYSKAGGIEREGVRTKKPIKPTPKTPTLAPKTKTDVGFEEETAQPDYETQLAQAEAVTIEQEEEGFTPVIEEDAKATDKEAFVAKQVKAQIDDGDFEKGSPIEDIAKKLWAARWDKINGEKQVQKNEEAGKESTTGTGSESGTQNRESVKESKAKTIRPGNRIPKARRKIKNPLAIEALKIETNTPYDKALQYFIKGGKVSPESIKTMFKNGRGEMMSRIGLLYKSAPSIDEIGHKLWEDRTEGDDRFDSLDYSNAVEDVLRSHNGTSSMINELLNSHDKSAEMGDMERFYVTPIESEFVDEAMDIWDSLSEEEKTYLANESNIPDSFWDSLLDEHDKGLDDEGPVYFQKEKSNAYKEIEKLIVKAEAELKAAKTSFDAKRKELDTKIVEDQEDLFGERKSVAPDSMFDERADLSQRNKVIEPFKVRLEKATENLKVLQKKLKDEEGNEDLTLFQKSSQMAPETKVLREKKIDLLKKALPGITVLEDDSLEGIAGQLDADGKTVRLNPNYNYSDTPIHEFGHALIDIMGGIKNTVISKGIEQLKDTNLWNETKERYPELSEEMLAKEVLAEAIGREGAKIFDTKERQSKFKNWLDGFFYKIKRLLGIDKNVAKKLASELLSGKRIESKTVASNEVQRSKRREENNFISSKPKSYKKWAASQKFDEFSMKERISELKDEIADAKGDQKDILEGELELTQNALKEQKQAYQDYVDDHKNIIEFIKSKGDVSKLTLDELNEIRTKMMKYDDVVKSKLYKDLLYNIGVKVNEVQSEQLKVADPNYDPEQEQKGDLSKADIWAQGLSTIGEKFPAIQAFYKLYRKASGEMSKEINDIRLKGHDLAQKVIKEYHKKHGVAERLKNFTTGGGNKYFSYLAQDGKLIEKGTPEYNKLTKVQKDLLDFITEEKATLDQYMDTDSNALLKSGAGFLETFQKSGIYKAYANYITKNHNIRNVKIQFKDPETGKTNEQYFGDVENILNEYAKQGPLKKVQAMALLTKYNVKARKGLEASKGSKGKYFLRPDGKLVSMFGGEFKGDFTENYYETFMKYAQDAVFSKNMSPLMPTLTGVEMFYKSMGSDKENVSKFLDVVKRGKFLGETIESGLGEKGDKALRLLRKWTSWRFIAFNIPANVWNIAVGEYNQFRADGRKTYAKGKKRLLGGLLRGKKNAKALNILKKYNPELVMDVDNIDPEKHVGKYFDMLAFGGQKVGEALIRGSAIVGRLSTEHYNWMDSKGNVKGSSPEQIAEREKIIKAEIAKYVAQVEKVQGRYSDVEKRNFAYFELGQFFGQFKVWMPEWLSDRFAKTYIDADGVKHKGSFRTLWGYGMRDFLRDATKKEFYTSNDPKHVAARKQLRGMIITAGLLSAYLGASDDDDDKEYANQLDKALRNISGIYRMDNNTFLISQPAAAMSVVVDLSKTLNAAISGQKYKSGENEGDYKALNMAYELLPGQNVISGVSEVVSGE